MKVFLNIVITFCMLSSVKVILGQQYNTDSLRQVWENQQQSPKERLLAANYLVKQKSKPDYDSTDLHLINEALAFALENKEDSLLVHFTFRKTAYYLHKKLMDSATFFMWRSLELAEKLNRLEQLPWMVSLMRALAFNTDNSGFYNSFFQQLIGEIEQTNIEKILLGDCYMQVSYYHNNNSNYSESIKWVSKSLEIYESFNLRKQVASAHKRISILYSRDDKYAKAIEHCFEAIKIYEKVKDKQSLSRCYTDLMWLYGMIGDQDSEMKYIDKAIQLAREIPDSSNLAYNLNQLGDLKSNQNEIQEALENYLKALEIYIIIGERGPDFGVPWTYGNIGDIYQVEGHVALEKGNKAVALDLFNQALDYFEMRFEAEKKMKDPYAHGGGYTSFGRIYKSLSEAVPNNQKAEMLTKSKYNFELALNIREKEKDRSSIYYLHEQLSIVCQLYGNIEQAFYHLKVSEKYFDSLQFTEARKSATLLQQQFEFDKIEAIKAIEEETKRKRQQYIVGSLVTILFFVVVFLVVVFKQRNNIRKERNKSEELLLNVLPSEVAEELKEKGESEARLFEEVTVIFTDFIQFTETAEKLTAKELVDEIDACFKAFDMIIQKHNIEKIKTIGDAYLAAAGLQQPKVTKPKDAVLAAIEFQEFILNRKKQKEAKREHSFDMRVGAHTGRVVAGIVGVKKFQYDIWGDTVNTASRIESYSNAGKVNISQVTYNFIKDDPEFTFESRGKIEVKGKGEINMYFVSLA